MIPLGNTDSSATQPSSPASDLSAGISIGSCVLVIAAFQKSRAFSKASLISEGVDGFVKNNSIKGGAVDGGGVISGVGGVTGAFVSNLLLGQT